ncbi:MAG: Stp1/IreP family PP2C-type Ser/Thr phosphatase [Clostridiales bacterium]|nr:Stp1/IreP family PP2C-type Ser/Thr phosphatase [Clostridiales bacterium]
MIKAYGKSDIGLVREKNEDFIFVSETQIGILENLFIISDGMGGCNAGEIASEYSILFFIEYIKKNRIHKLNDKEILDLLKNALNYANNKVFEASCNNHRLNGMGATFSGTTFFEENFYFVHVGDSRIYFIDSDNIKQISIDHTYVNELLQAGKINKSEAKNHPKKNIITRAVGTKKNIEIDVFKLKSKKNKILMCSDGLTNCLNDKEIFNIVDKNKNNINKSLNELIDKSKLNGGYDNISVILIEAKR